MHINSIQIQNIIIFANRIKSYLIEPKIIAHIKGFQKRKTNFIVKFNKNNYESLKK